MKINITNARRIAETLTLAADAAMAKGEYEFDLIETVKSLDDSARADLEAAIAQAKQAPAEG